MAGGPLTNEELDRRNARRIARYGVLGALAAAIVAAGAAILSADLTNRHADADLTKQLSAQRTQDASNYTRLQKEDQQQYSRNAQLAKDQFLRAQRIAAYKAYVSAADRLGDVAAPIGDDLSMLYDHRHDKTFRLIADRGRFHRVVIEVKSTIPGLQALQEQVHLVASEPVRDALDSDEDATEEAAADLLTIDDALQRSDHGAYDKAIRRFIEDDFNADEDYDADFQAAIRKELGTS